MSDRAFMVAKEEFHHRNGNIFKTMRMINDDKQFFLSQFNYINKHLYFAKFNHLKLRTTDPSNFLTKRALGEPTKHACGCWGHFALFEFIG